ncbi:4-hydroxy-tetrahydrodipicolinate reductase [Alkalibaculum sp. M08DMB]|uniref:4-hydroxy-tetrahydrodipicolinate reductase n=1 Tax=Alkalibaculum sporogenes TaxID=2655001 RepID=A0A6A7K5M2_9FIRM|nr:4-hydroxy-tetrahydrodipicolinate reductase [Alkalibaculum sporogenes]MPW24700.1 4-hydroxy-tetrahydrodipicolinate reductase [Alkalibaculum sporogenes]
MINVLLSGCNGGMGRVLQELISNEKNMQVIAGYDSTENNNNSYKVYTDIDKCNEKIDVIIDFSHYTAFNSVLKYSLDKQVALVMATTGLTAENEQSLLKASKIIPIFRTANMSIGINVLLGLVAEAAKQLEEFDIELIEKHHNKKVDSPSGTALMLANEINDALNNSLEYTYGREGKSTRRNSKELGIHAVRGGTISGEHTVIYAGEDEIIEIKHTATSKKVFAKGAIKAAKFITNKENGFFDMRKVLKS